MKRYAVFNSDGRVVRTVSCELEQVACQTQLGESILPHETASIDTHYFDGSIFATTPNQPTPNHTWNWSSKTWVAPLLVVLQDAKWSLVKIERSHREVATFTCAGLTFDCNTQAISGATLSAFIAKMAGTSWTQPWVLADNSMTLLNADQMIAVGQACKAYIAGLWATSQALRGQIDAAQTAEAVAEVAWP